MHNWTMHIFCLPHPIQPNKCKFTCCIVVDMLLEAFDRRLDWSDRTSWGDRASSLTWMWSVFIYLQFCLPPPSSTKSAASVTSSIPASVTAANRNPVITTIATVTTLPLSFPLLALAVWNLLQKTSSKTAARLTRRLEREAEVSEWQWNWHNWQIPLKKKLVCCSTGGHLPTGSYPALRQ